MAVENWPGEHCRHVPDETAPRAVEYCPTKHAGQWANGKPTAVEYWPAEHLSQLLAPWAVEYVPATHDTHADMLATFEYCPAAQGVQALSWWGAQIVDAKEPAGHIWQALQYSGPVTRLSSGPITPNSEPPACGPQ